MRTVVTVIKPTEYKVSRKRAFWMALASLVPFVGLAAVFYLYLYPSMSERRERAVFYASMIILLMGFILTLLGHIYSLRGLRRYRDTTRFPIRPALFFIKIYVTISLIPMLCIAVIFLTYFIPRLLEQGELVLVYTTLGVFGFAFLLSILGYFLIRKAVGGIFEVVHKSREHLKSLTRLSAQMAESTLLDVVSQRAVLGIRALLGTAAAYWFPGTAGDDGPELEDGHPFDQLSEDDRRKVAEMRAWLVREPQTVCFDGAGFGLPLLKTGQEANQILGVPVMQDQSLAGVLLLVHKQTPPRVFTHSEMDLVRSWSLQLGTCIGHARFHEIQINYFTHTVELLVHALESNVVPRDHLRNVARYAGLIARKLKIEEKERRNIYFASLLHDIGMLKIPSAFCAVPEQYRLHPAIGAEMVGRVVLWQDLVPIIRYHHENYDGSGYPEGLMGPEIPLSARIVAVAESFDAMTNPNSYRTALPIPLALQDLQRLAGEKYDPKLVEIFEQEMKELEGA